MSLLLLMFLNILNAATRPVTPQPEVDMELTGKLTAREFFKKRAADKECSAELEKQRQLYRTQKLALIELKKSGGKPDALDAKEAENLKTLKTLLVQLRKCGDCLVKPVVTGKPFKMPGSNQTEVWTVADGSCQLAQEDKKILEDIFQVSVDTMLDIHKYPGRNNGFPLLLEFEAMDYKKAIMLPNVGKLESPTEVYAFVGVQGPKNPIGYAGFQYIGKNTVVAREKNGLKELIISMSGVENPNGFEEPSMNVISAGGKKFKIFPLMSLTRVEVMWYLNSDGYSRYYTAADFGHLGALDYLQSYAEETLLNTLHRQVERSLGNP